MELIHSKNDANSAIKGAIEYWGDDDDIVDETLKQLAETYLEAEPIHRLLSKKIGWDVPPTIDEQIPKMRAEIERAENSAYPTLRPRGERGSRSAAMVTM